METPITQIECNFSLWILCQYSNNCCLHTTQDIQLMVQKGHWDNNTSVIPDEMVRKMIPTKLVMKIEDITILSLLIMLMLIKIDGNRDSDWWRTKRTQKILKGRLSEDLAIWWQSVQRVLWMMIGWLDRNLLGSGWPLPSLTWRSFQILRSWRRVTRGLFKRFTRRGRFVKL